MPVRDRRDRALRPWLRGGRVSSCRRSVSVSARAAFRSAARRRARRRHLRWRDQAATPPTNDPGNQHEQQHQEQRQRECEHRRLARRTGRTRTVTGARFATANITIASASGSRMSAVTILRIMGAPRHRPSAQAGIHARRAIVTATGQIGKSDGYGSPRRACGDAAGMDRTAAPPCSAARAFPCRS